MKCNGSMRALEEEMLDTYRLLSVWATSGSGWLSVTVESEGNSNKKKEEERPVTSQAEEYARLTEQKTITA